MDGSRLQTQATPLHWIKIVNPDAQDCDRIGHFVREVNRDDDPDLRMRFIVINFGDGDEGSYADDEIQRIYVS